MLPNIVPLEDEEVSTELAKAFKKQGINVLTNHKVTSLEAKNGAVEVVVEAEGETKSLAADQALVSIGVKPNSQNLGLENVGVNRSDNGMVEIDDRMATNVSGIWAIGECPGKAVAA